METLFDEVIESVENVDNDNWFTDWDDSIPDDEIEGDSGEEYHYIGLFNEFSQEDQEYYGMLTKCDMLFDRRAVYFGTGIAIDVQPPGDSRMPFVAPSKGSETWVEVYYIAQSLLKEIDDYMNYDEPLFQRELVRVKPFKALFKNEILAFMYF